ncbi:hypothetical protein LNP26_01490 [Klebsiella variicola subsp. variicola]|nr:hypothetical protein [Klebsiella variicola subsp. variicola]
MIALMRPLKSLTNVNAQFQRGWRRARRCLRSLDSEQEKDEGTRVIERAKGNLEFENVTFTYPGREGRAAQYQSRYPGRENRRAGGALRVG